MNETCWEPILDGICYDVAAVYIGAMPFTQVPA